VVKVVTAVRRELRELGQLGSALGAGAVVLAKRLEDPETNSSAVPAYQRELRETMAVLRRVQAGGEQDRMSEFEQRARDRDRKRASS
jgi:hypothetical protein